MKSDIKPDSLWLWITGRETAKFCDARRADDAESPFGGGGKRLYDGLPIRVFASDSSTQMLVGGHKRLKSIGFMEDCDLKEIIHHFVRKIGLSPSHPCYYLVDDWTEWDFRGWSKTAPPKTASSA